MFTLDQTDLMILYHLQNDARMPFTKLASKVNLTSAAVNYRVERLISRRIIKKFTIDIDKFQLTPSYQAYYVSMNINPADIEINYKILYASQLFERIIQVASSFNLVGITIPLSNKNMSKLIEVISNRSIINYSITPIINDYKRLDNEQLFGEDIQNLYCPECQDIVEGAGFIDQIGSQEFGFCCKECRDVFSKNYLKIIN